LGQHAFEFDAGTVGGVDTTNQAFDAAGVEGGGHAVLLLVLLIATIYKPAAADKRIKNCEPCSEKPSGR
jgi:hypothetical protein